MLHVVCFVGMEEFPYVTEEANEHLSHAINIHHKATFSTSNLIWIGFEIEPCIPCLC